jgi:hypothetical protein
MKHTLLPLMILVLSTSGCSGVKPEDHAGSTPPLDPFEYFVGQTRAWGIFQDRSGRVQRRFTVDILGEKVGGDLVLTEDFVYADGERSQRVWRIRKTDQDAYQGRADDVVGFATGRTSGASLNWQYDLRLAVNGRSWTVHFDDWMFLQEDGVLINRATMSKFGFKLGEVTLVFQRERR